MSFTLYSETKLIIHAVIIIAVTIISILLPVKCWKATQTVPLIRVFKNQMAKWEYQLNVCSYVITVNREIFMYENIHVLNVCVNKFSWGTHEILIRIFSS